ncbi:hypothetical protein NE237_030125 [Protea cynaroides]|uniref:Uncharacterized protein n=1 Tax=Protea cynaroides TaxID=273540 RepID=A0A9Q0GT43_9MAGN|nr:hypothetical protein NE237_030125 [Protea cynaroides]
MVKAPFHHHRKPDFHGSTSTSSLDRRTGFSINDEDDTTTSFSPIHSEPESAEAHHYDKKFSDLKKVKGFERINERVAVVKDSDDPYRETQTERKNTKINWVGNNKKIDMVAGVNRLDPNARKKEDDWDFWKNYVRPAKTMTPETRNSGVIRNLFKSHVMKVQTHIHSHKKKKKKTFIPTKKKSK